MEPYTLTLWLHFIPPRRRQLGAYLAMQFWAEDKQCERMSKRGYIYPSNDAPVEAPGIRATVFVENVASLSRTRRRHILYVCQLRNFPHAQQRQDIFSASRESPTTETFHALRQHLVCNGILAECKSIPSLPFLSKLQSPKWHVALIVSDR